MSSLASWTCTRNKSWVGSCDRMTTDLVLEALQQAVTAKKPKKGYIHHSERGSEYASKAGIHLSQTKNLKPRKKRSRSYTAIASFYDPTAP